MLTHKKVLQYMAGSDRIASTTESVSGDGETAYDGVIPTSGTPNVEIDVAFAFANVKSLVLYSSQAMTLKTNSSGAPDDTIVIPAGGAIVWNTNDVAACPFTANVTKIYATNGSASVTATLRIRVLLDVTP